MMQYSIQPRDFCLLSFAKNIGKNIGKNKSKKLI